MQIGVCGYVGSNPESRENLRHQITKIKTHQVYYFIFGEDGEYIEKEMIRMKQDNIHFFYYPNRLKVFSAKYILDKIMEDQIGPNPYLSIEDDYEISERTDWELDSLDRRVRGHDLIILNRYYDPQWDFPSREQTGRGFLRPTENRDELIFDPLWLRYKMNTLTIPHFIDTREGVIRRAGDYRQAIHAKLDGDPILERFGDEFYSRETAYTNWWCAVNGLYENVRNIMVSTFEHMDKPAGGPIQNYVEEMGSKFLETPEEIKATVKNHSKIMEELIHV